MRHFIQQSADCDAGKKCPNMEAPFPGLQINSGNMRLNETKLVSTLPGIKSVKNFHIDILSESALKRNRDCFVP